jgi:hypothetical protein
MSWDRIQAEEAAFQSLLAFYEQAKKTRELYERARMPLPPRLKRFLDLDATESQTGKPRQRLGVDIPPPDVSRPTDIPPDWVWVPIENCIPVTLIQAVIRLSGKTMPGRDVIEQIVKLRPNIPSGSIYNAATRLEKNEILHRESGQWTLVKDGPLIEGGMVWGEPSMFAKEELAAVRRQAILHVLKYFSGGLEIMQLIEQLRNCGWVKAPVNKDLLKADVKVLESDKKIRRRGNTRKWELIPMDVAGKEKPETE